MKLKVLTVAAFAVAVSAQQSLNRNLTELIASQSSLSALGNLLGSYPDIASQLASARGVTLFAPNNAAIGALTRSGALDMATPDQIQAILSYHVVGFRIFAPDIDVTPKDYATILTNSSYTNVTGGQVVQAALEGQSAVLTSGFKLPATIVDTDLLYDHGVVHIIDSVLTIPPNVSTTAIAADLSALAGALVATDLLTTVDTTKDVTIFAPSNDAFAAIGSAAGNLTTNQLAGILEYHVVAGSVAYSSLLGNGSVETLGGGSVNITVIDGAVFVNAARVITADILVANGVIHVIDSVLNPDGSAEPEPDSDQPVVQFAGASSAPIGALTSAIPMPSTTISDLLATTDAVGEGYTTRTANGALPTSGQPAATGMGGGETTSSSAGIAAMATGMVGAAALFGGAAMAANW